MCYCRPHRRDTEFSISLLSDTSLVVPRPFHLSREEKEEKFKHRLKLIPLSLSFPVSLSISEFIYAL